MICNAIFFSWAAVSPGLAAGAWIGLRLKTTRLLSLKRLRENLNGNWRIKLKVIVKKTFWKVALG